MLYFDCSFQSLFSHQALSPVYCLPLPQSTLPPFLFREGQAEFIFANNDEFRSFCVTGLNLWSKNSISLTIDKRYLFCSILFCSHHFKLCWSQVSWNEVKHLMKSDVSHTLFYYVKTFFSHISYENIIWTLMKWKPWEIITCFEEVWFNLLFIHWVVQVNTCDLS